MDLQIRTRMPDLFVRNQKKQICHKVDEAVSGDENLI